MNVVKKMNDALARGADNMRTSAQMIGRSFCYMSGYFAVNVNT